MRKNGILSFALIVGLLTSGAVKAATVTTTGSGTTGNVHSVGALSLPKFDALLGTLTGIAIDWTFSFSVRFVADKIGALDFGTVSAADGFVTSTVTATTSPAAAATPMFSETAGTAFDVAIPSAYDQTITGSFSQTTNLGPLVAFIGNGLLNYAFVGSARDIAITSIGVSRGLTEYLYKIDADITYTYNDGVPFSGVPVPAALPLALAGLGLLGCLKLRRDAKVLRRSA